MTRAVPRLFPAPASRDDALVAFTDFDKVVAFLSFLQVRLAATLSAYGVMWNDYYHEVTAEGWHRAPLPRDHPFYVVFRAEGADPGSDKARFGQVLADALDEGLIADVVLPKSDSEVREIWNIREDFEAILEMQPSYLYDVSLHFFVIPGQEGDHFEMCSECVYEPLRPYGGSVSAEHCIGTSKMRWLPHSRSATDIELMHTLKRTLDPKNILNPGRNIDEIG